MRWSRYCRAYSIRQLRRLLTAWKVCRKSRRLQMYTRPSMLCKANLFPSLQVRHQMVPKASTSTHSTSDFCSKYWPAITNITSTGRLVGKLTATWWNHLTFLTWLSTSDPPRISERFRSEIEAKIRCWFSLLYRTMQRIVWLDSFLKVGWLAL